MSYPKFSHKPSQLTSPAHPFAKHMSFLLLLLMKSQTYLFICLIYLFCKTSSSVKSPFHSIRLTTPSVLVPSTWCEVNECLINKSTHSMDLGHATNKEDCIVI